MLYFPDGFNDAFFQDVYHLAMQDDPVLGKGTFRHTARFGPEQCYVSHKLLVGIEKGFIGMDEFARYKEALKGFDEDGSKEINLEYLQKATRTFFERFCALWDKYMTSKWLDSLALHYIIHRDKYHTRDFVNGSLITRTKLL